MLIQLVLDCYGVERLFRNRFVNIIFRTGLLLLSVSGGGYRRMCVFWILGGIGQGGRGVMGMD